MRCFARLVAASILCTSCGSGDAPTAPQPAATAATPLPAPTPAPVFAVIDGVSEAPTGASIAIRPDSPRLGDVVTVTADGYPEREERWDGAPIALWYLGGEGGPLLRSYLDLIYGGDPAGHLRRWSGTRYSVALGTVSPAALPRTAEIKQRLSGVFADIASAGGPVFTWTEEPFATVTVTVNPDDACLEGRYAACTRWWENAGSITRAELIFAAAAGALNDRVSMHSAGHMIGLNDWSKENAAMYPGYPATMFIEFERNAIHMMYHHRKPGNLPTDRDPGALASGLRRFEVAH